MGKRAPSPPPAPDPIATAKAQTTSNVQTAVANTAMSNANEFSPFGTVTYDQYGTKRVGDEDVPLYNRTTTLSPEQQALYNNETQIGIRAGNLGLQQIDKLGSILNSPIADAPQFKTVSDYLGGDLQTNRNRVEDALMQRLNPQLDRDRASLETQLVNQGLVRGTDAFNTAVDQANRQATDARLAVIANAGAEQDRTFNQALQSAGFDNSALQQGWTNDIQRRVTPINEVGALLGLGQVQVPQAPAYQPGQVAGTPVGQYVYQSYQGNLDAWKTQAQMPAQNNSIFGSALGSLFGLGGSLLGRSDRRLKRDISALGVRLPNGLPLYSFRYKDGESLHVGVMADEVERVIPSAVFDMPDGFKAVDYGQVVR